MKAACLVVHVKFLCAGEEVAMVPTFTYLGRIVLKDGDNWPTIWHNLRKARKVWAQVLWILACDKVSPQISALFYRAIIQLVLLYTCETWMVDECKLHLLSNFHHSVARPLTGHQPQRDPAMGEWIEKVHIERFWSSVGCNPLWFIFSTNGNIWRIS